MYLNLRFVKLNAAFNKKLNKFYLVDKERSCKKNNDNNYGDIDYVYKTKYFVNSSVHAIPFGIKAETRNIKLFS